MKKYFRSFSYEWKGRQYKRKVDITKKLQKPAKRTSWEEVVHNGWSTRKETNPVETKLKMFFTSEH